MNQTIIQERSGLNQFYAKVYAFLWDLGLVYQLSCQL